MIGTSDGQQHEDEFSYLSALHGGPSAGMPVTATKQLLGATGKPAGEFKSSLGTQVAPVIDRTKDVPLAASALHKDGEMYGIAIDKDAPHKPEYDQYIYKHEADEFAYMKDLIKIGMSPTEAYPKAHDHITPMESARVQADLGEKGLEDYKQYWRDVASVSTAKETADRHPDAHTTTYGLDEHELGRSFRKEAIFRGLKGAGITKNDADFKPPEPIGRSPTTPMTKAPFAGKTLPMSWSAPTEQKWFKGGDGKWRQEIPDRDAKIKPDAFKQREKSVLNYDGKGGSNISKETVLSVKPDQTLEDVLHHPDLFQSYPDLKNIQIVPTHPSWERIKGGVSEDGGTIYLKPGLSDKENKSILLHEIQHAIQKIEGFIKGSSPDRMKPVIDQALKNTGQDGWDKTRPSQDDIDRAAYQAYHNVGGEVESRNVQRRMNWPRKALDIFSPSFTEDVPRDRQLNPPE